MIDLHPRLVALRSGRQAVVDCRQAKAGRMQAALSLAGAPLVLDKAAVAKAPEIDEAGRIGVDIARRYRAMLLDFDSMRFSSQP